MSCQHCQGQSCIQCSQLGQASIQAQLGAQQGLAAQQNYYGQLGAAQYQGQLNQAVYMSATRNQEMEFMMFIDGKTDDQIALAFAEKQNETKRAMEEKLEKTRNDFLELCVRFRPTITDKLLERVAKLKAFW